MTTLTTEHARAWADRFVAVGAERDTELTELDRKAGDGDYGTNLRSALRRAAVNLSAGPASPHEVFLAVSEAFLNTGGTSGPLFGMWFREFAKAAKEKDVTAAVLGEAATNAVAVVQRLGKAEVGHKTMVDAMVPAAEALTAAAARGAGVSDALAEAASAAHAGAASTEKLLAKRGRASYVGEHARGVIDPGALTVAYFFDAAAPPRN
ncbi:dihydroxyacetone kinase subunit DhaL [Allokutzneria sp. A3M-2-11 16]|uniref:dihydroxyacetone kinase subunit DhaL n=1 Tax=Allokutzneria sp. A3M-2-11 16 TaxID=2962043 RepID=UPI0020B792B6|nr:dihydroxyacetone kinase subunit DhaL [Allokutzneria sp. A3M-2-11 16]MCP3798352.1 dihydroxyacetone kinase subunit DhaL [Allokutzneria sp. A3M-2-11 16]